MSGLITPASGPNPTSGAHRRGALAEYLGEALDDPAEVAKIWHRWMLEINADEDLDYAGG